MGSKEARKKIEEARERMLEGEDTPWLDRETHRGEEPRVKDGGVTPDIEADATEHRGKENTAGAFGKQKGTPDEWRHGDDTRDKAIEQMEGVVDEG